MRYQIGLSSAVAAILLAGCGGGGSSSHGLTSIATPSAPSAVNPVTAHFHVDVQTGKVTIDKRTSSALARTIFSGTAITFNSTDLYTLNGNTGTRQLGVSITNNSGLELGSVNSSTTGLNVLFSNFSNIGTFPDVRSLTNVSTAGSGFSSPYGVAAAGSGVYYVADTYHNQIKAVKNGVVSLVAGKGTTGGVDGVGTNANFNLPVGIAIEQDGSLIVADAAGCKIRRISLAGQVSTIAGTGTAGAANGTGDSATFNHPWGIAIDANSNIYVADSNNSSIRLIQFEGYDPTVSSQYVVSTVAGGSGAGLVDGVGAAAKFSRPYGIAYSNGYLYVADGGNNTVRRISSSAAVTTIAGTGTAGITDGAGNVATFNAPIGITATSNAVYVSEGASTSGAINIRQISPLPGNSGSLTTSAGWQTSTVAGNGVKGYINGTGNVAEFNAPQLMSIDNSGNIVLADSGNNVIREISPSQGVFPVGIPSGGTPSSEMVQLSNASGHFDANASGSNIPYINYNVDLPNGDTSETENWWFIVPSGVNAFEFDVTVQTLTQGLVGPGAQTGAGDATEQVSTIGGNLTAGNVDGVYSEARFSSPYGITFADSGYTFIADSGNAAIRIASPGGVVKTIAGGAGLPFSDGTGNSAGLTLPYGVAYQANGYNPNVYFTDGSTVRIATFNPPATLEYPSFTDAGNWTISTIAGSSTTSSTVDGLGNVARFNRGNGIVVSPAGDLYVADQSGNNVRKLHFLGGATNNPKNWLVSTVAGSKSGTAGHADGTGTAASFDLPGGVCMDQVGNLYVADYGNSELRKITPDGVVSTVAGNSSKVGYLDGASTVSELKNPQAVTIDTAGYLYIADQGNFRIRRLSPGGILATVAGQATSGHTNGQGPAASFSKTDGIIIDTSGDIVVSDGNTIRVIQKQITTGVN